MCRFLCVRAVEEFAMADHLEHFALTAKNSSEDQSHGWGCAWMAAGHWTIYRSLKPVWEDDLGIFANTGYLLAHARSAYKNDGITLYNNMPFFDGQSVFVFNGDLQGVRIREHGRIGAEKVFNYIKRLNEGNMLDAVSQAVKALNDKSRYVRALNFVLAQPDACYVSSTFNENPVYFQLHEKRTADSVIISSSPYENDAGWRVIPNHTTRHVHLKPGAISG